MLWIRNNKSTHLPPTRKGGGTLMQTIHYGRIVFVAFNNLRFSFLHSVHCFQIFGSPYKSHYFHILLRCALICAVCMPLHACTAHSYAQWACKFSTSLKHAPRTHMCSEDVARPYTHVLDTHIHSENVACSDTHSPHNRMRSEHAWCPYMHSPHTHMRIERVMKAHVQDKFVVIVSSPNIRSWGR